MRETINIDCKHIWDAIQRLRKADGNMNMVENEIARVISKHGVEQKHGHWQIVKECEAYFNECSNCKGRLWEVEPEWIFCPYCACKMEEVAE